MQSGSSPLTRGKHAHLGCSSDQKRLIPAHAGKTSKTQPTSSPPQAHPHSRGENVLEPIRKTIQQGSSPLTRGKQRGSVYDRVQHGLIPTHAGKTLLLVIGQGEGGAHPHSRGENLKRLENFTV